MNVQNGISEDGSGSQEPSGEPKGARDLALSADEGNFLPWPCFQSSLS